MAFVNYGVSRGLDPQLLFAKCQLDFAYVKEPFALVPAATFLKCIALLRDSLGEPAIGLYAGQWKEWDLYDTLGYYFMSLPDLREALSEAYRIARELPHLAQPHLEQNKGISIAHLSGIPKETPGGVEYATCTTTWSLMVLRTLSGQELIPDSVCLTEPEPLERHPYEKFFQCPIVFDSPEPFLVFPDDWFNLPNKQANPGLSKVLKPYVEKHLELNPQAKTVSKAVCNNLKLRISNQKSISLNCVARDLAMGPRTLQKRLQKEGVQFSDLLDTERKSAVLQLLFDPNMKLEDIASSLGFRDVSSLHRSFRRWFGTTPSQYRETLSYEKLTQH
ncbi:MAG: AraC family transcriptional regulator [Deltaproteobacteria bacterium]|nr:AraC family transcriptional regulator [Deltaproteobacteria bacterium]